TWWETIWKVVLPAARAGIFGATVLALGRALGETIAVAMVIGNRPSITTTLFGPAYTLASVIANEFREATGPLYPPSLIFLGLVPVSHVEFFFNTERPVGIPGGGIAHAFVGTIVMVALASLLAIPVGVIAGIQLVEYGTGRVGDSVRLACDVLVGIPSIVIGL